MNGLGTQALTGSNTFTGGITVNAGTLLIDASKGGSVAATNTLALGGGTFELNNTASGTAASQTLGAVSLTAGGSGITVLNNGNSSPATLTLGTLAAPATLGATLNVQGTNIDFNTAYNAATGNATAGSHMVFTNGSTTTWATNTNANTATAAYSGDSTTLVASAGSGGTNYNLQGSLGSVGTETIGLLRIYNTSAASALTQTGGTTLTLSTTTGTFGGLLFNAGYDYTITGGTIKGGGASDKELVIQNYGNSTNGTGPGGTGSLTIGSVIADNSAGTALTMAGTGKTILTGTNTYTGVTYLNGGITNFSQIANFGTGTGATGGITFGGGTLQYASGNSADLTAPTAKTITVNQAGGTIDVNGNNVTFGTAWGTGVGGMTYTDSSNGSGFMNLDNTISYTGFTTIGDGTHTSKVNLNGTVGTTSAGTIITNGGVLSGGVNVGSQNGQATNRVAQVTTSGFAGKITLMPGGILKPGNYASNGSLVNALPSASNGTSLDGNHLGLQVNTVQGNVLNASGLNWNAGGKLQFSLSNAVIHGTALDPAPSTLLNLGTGALNLIGTGTFTLDFMNTGAYNSGSGVSTNVYDLINFGAINSYGTITPDATFDGSSTDFNVNDFTITNLNGVGTLSLYYNSLADNGLGQEELLLTVVPEPSTWAMLLGGLVALVFWTRRRGNSRRVVVSKTK